MKEITVVFVSKILKEDYENLNAGKFEDKELYLSMGKAIFELKHNPFVGIKIQKKLWPKMHIKKYQITNLYKYNLSNAHRLIYTIKTDDIKIYIIFLEWFNHKDYEKRFKY